MSPAGKPATPRVAIIGAGAAGICMGVRLREAGIESFTLFEKATSLGGTWRDNTYPGAGCDVPSHMYCFSFEPKADWSRAFAEQPEILTYFEHVSNKYGVTPHIRFGCEVTGARYDDARAVWVLTLGSGEQLEFDVLVPATGQLNRPAYPNLPGSDDFAGAKFHSARWDHAIDLHGKNVSVIGNGASAVQFIPRIGPLAKKLNVFQRTPNWIMPKPDYQYPSLLKGAFAAAPGLMRAYRNSLYWRLEGRVPAFLKDSLVASVLNRIARHELERKVPDKALREKLTPSYRVGCKRILISNEFLEALQEPNVEVITTPITRVTRDAVVTNDGVAHPTDVLIFATGFTATQFLAPMTIHGRGGTTLDDAWKSGAEAHLGITVAGFPNLFVLYGPNTSLGHNSVLFMIECQVQYTLSCIDELRQKKLRALEVKRDAMDEFNRELNERLRGTVWDNDCGSWYKTAEGKLVSTWPGYTFQYWWRTRKPNFAEYVERA